MTFAIRVDAAQWRGHVQHVVDEYRNAGATAVPVVKSNGYGLGQNTLVEAALHADCSSIAVGTVFEALELLPVFNGDILIMQPYEPADLAAADAWLQIGEHGHRDRIIRTIASQSALDDVIEQGELRVVIEVASSTRRFGFATTELRGNLVAIEGAVADGRIRLEGLSVHLPLMNTQADIAGILNIAEPLAAAIWKQLWISHIDARQAAAIFGGLVGWEIKVRVGTRLWLGKREALRATGTVLSVQPVKAGDRAGYRGRKISRTGWLITVSGGTAHGIGLEAPSTNTSLRQRAVALAVGGLDALGIAKSPFSFDGDDLWFHEPPHQQVSMLVVPSSARQPIVGELLPADVRFTTTRADIIVGLD